jgi:hypothetical protein
MAQRTSFLVLCSWWMVLGAFAANEAPGTKNQEPASVVFRPEAGKFPPIEKAHTYQGELAFVDHATRRGTLRVKGPGIFRSTEPNPFVMLPYGMVRYHGAPADLRDIPLGTMLHVTAFLPPDPKLSSVPVLPTDNKDRDANHRRGVGVFPAENHVLLLEDEPSFRLRTGSSWTLKEIELKADHGIVIARLDAEGSELKLTVDHATRIWRGQERLNVAELIAEGTWSAGTKKSLNDQKVQLGLSWKPCPDGIFFRQHVSDLWLDEAALRRAGQRQAETHKTFMRSRWLPGWVDAVEYGKFGRATVTVTLFGGKDPSLYDDFRAGGQVFVNGAENTLKHTEAGSAGPSQMAVRGPIVGVSRIPGEAPTGSSGIQVRFETDLVTEGIRPTRIVRLRPASWPDVHLPREEYVDGNSGNLEERFPTPATLPKY